MQYQKITDAINALDKTIEKMTATTSAQTKRNEERVTWDCAQFVVDDEDDCNDSEIHEQNKRTFSEEEKQLQRKKKHEYAISWVKKRTLTMGCHHGVLPPLPQDWEFPSMTWTQLIQNWFLGNQDINLPPLIDLNSKIVSHCNKGSGNKMRLNMKAVMMIVEIDARKLGVLD